MVRFSASVTVTLFAVGVVRRRDGVAHRVDHDRGAVHLIKLRRRDPPQRVFGSHLVAVGVVSQIV